MTYGQLCYSSLKVYNGCPKVPKQAEAKRDVVINPQNYYSCRSKVTPEKMDKWFSDYKDFISDLELMDKPHRIWNADETGFAMGSKGGNVLGPSKAVYAGPIPHVSGGSGKDRLTVMYSAANAEGTLMPPFLVYPEPRPTAYDPLTGATRGTSVEYSTKGWMNSNIFLTFIDHFDRHAGEERPVVLLIDSVSSHINMDVFTTAKEKGIEIYMLVPNATHLMQPLDKGVFGLLKKEWNNTIRKNTRDNPANPATKKTFARKLAETQVEFYAPKKVIGSFKGAGIYPINRDVISNEKLRPASTFEDDTFSSIPASSNTQSSPIATANGAEQAFCIFTEVLVTPKIISIVLQEKDL